MVSKKRARYEMIYKTAIIHKLDENLHTSGPNAQWIFKRYSIHDLKNNLIDFTNN